MRRLLVYLSFAGFLFQAALASADQHDWQTATKRVAEMGIELQDHPDARVALQAHIKACGLGIVKGWRGENRCHYQISVDAWFFKPLRAKTGLKHDQGWAYQPGVEFVTASAKEMDEVPEAWDLSEVGPMTDIHSQMCGDCWSTSSRKLLEQALATHGELSEAGDLIKLSAQTTLSSCCTWCGSCNGGYMATANFFSTEGDNGYGYGLPTRDLDPYQGRDSRCRFDRTELRELPYKLKRAPYIGSSLQHSRFFPQAMRNGPKVENIMANMIKYKSNALVTIQAISQSGGIIKNCSAINAPGDHMQNVVGWYQDGGQTIARVQNSWGRNHGQDGYTHIRWECGTGRFNRGLGRTTRIGIYKLPERCPFLAKADTGPDQRFVKTSDSKGVILGRPASTQQNCRWLPNYGIEEVLSANGCQVRVNPKMATEYHLLAKDTVCATEVSSMVLVIPTDAADQALMGGQLLTPHGMAGLRVR